MIRKATNKDLKKISEIFRSEYNKPPYNYKWSEKMALKKIKDYFKNNYMFVLKVEKKIIGFIILSTFLWSEGTRGLIDEVIVSSKHQGKGFGKELLNYAEDFFKKKKARRIVLYSKTSKAFKIYKKKGYKEFLVAMIKNANKTKQ